MHLVTQIKQLLRQGNRRLGRVAVAAACAALGLAAGARPVAAQMSPEQTVKSLKVAEGLEVTCWASEPMLYKPANIDVDSKGRVWVCEGVNYRKWSNPPLRPEGDRIMVLEDTTGSGKADKATVFYQGKDVNCALGICVLGNHVIVSCSPYVMILTDTQGTGHADKKEIFFSGVKGVQHDHGMHTFVFGPDGKLYFNFGNAGETIARPDGKTVVDVYGNEVANGKHNPKGDSPASGATYRQGMVFRCNPDGSEFEVLGHNFRNNFEVNVDSFGTVWQSDNDDDGNRGVRVNYVMEFGNYGYTDEMTGAGWQSKRTNLEKEIPLRHWHLNDPGVVPNLLQTGQGSPTGICVYEGRLLPPVFQGQVIHCDAGPNVVRSYPVKPSGAGYSAEIVDVLKGGDKWFRPSDVCVAPDGALIVADWYDPGVGGHAMGDHLWPHVHGRLYRVAPPGNKPSVPTLDLSSADGAIAALASPNLATRYLAWTALHEMGDKAEPALNKLWHGDDARLRARALWLLSKIPGKGQPYVEQALRDSDPNLRITALRAARQLKMDVVPLVRALAGDANYQVLRECAIALHANTSSQMPEAWADLAARHDANDLGDRWYVEALGIGAAGRDAECLAAYLKKAGEAWNTPAGRDVIWRTRAPQSAEYLGKIILDPRLPDDDRPRFIRALDFLPNGAEKTAVLEQMVNSTLADKSVVVEALTRLKASGANLPQLAQIVNRTLEARKGTPEFVDLCELLDVRDRDAELVEIAVAHPSESMGAAAARLVLRSNSGRALLTQAIGGDVDRAAKIVTALANVPDGSATPMLTHLALDKTRGVALRQEAVRGLARTPSGAKALLDLARKDQLPKELAFTAGQELRTSSSREVRDAAGKLFPAPTAKDATPLPPVAELAKRQGNVASGHRVWVENCSKCHRIGNEGIDFGPNQSEIGSKYGKDFLITKVLNPNVNIAFGYEGKVLKLKAGGEVDGVLVGETAEEYSLKAVTGIITKYKRGEVTRVVAQKLSIMPEGLQQNMTHQEFVDLVEYLAALKKPAGGPAPDAGGSGTAGGAKANSLPR